MIKRNETAALRKHRGQGKQSNRLGTSLVVFGCALILIAGFFFAARQHFASMDSGMNNSRLRKQVDQLEAEKRRLLLAREVSMSPGEIKKAARKAGMLDPLPNQIDSELAQFTSATKVKPKATQADEGKRLVVKTSATSPAPRAVPASFKQEVRPDKPSK